MIRDLLLIVFILAGAIGASQVPRFVQEYEQRLGGARDEARLHLRGFEAIAKTRGLSFEKYLGELAAEGGDSGAATSTTIRQMGERADWLDLLQEHLGKASHLKRTWVVFSKPDPEILRATWAVYRPGVFLDSQHGLIGVGISWLLFVILSRVFGAIFFRRKVRRARG
ncbi:MAG: DUF2937 family protein [Rhodospirillaceae bacterium]|nr:DUF2937 family protein [Rhodospirillaceae bacterium]